MEEHNHPTSADGANSHPIYDQLKQLATQGEFIMHCVTLHFSPDGFAQMSDVLRDTYLALLDKTDMTASDRSDMKDQVAKYFSDAKQMRETIEVLRLREMQKKGKQL